MTKFDEKHFCICIAGQTILLDTLYPETYALCIRYLCDHEPVFHIQTSVADIEIERDKTIGLYGSKREEMLEMTAVCRKLSEAMLDVDTFLMHGAVVAVGNEAYMFTAESGVGKTTHINKWLSNIPDAYVINGDKPFLKVTDTQVIACGSPWCGKEGMNTNTMMPLKAIVIMERGQDNRIDEVSFPVVLTDILKQVYLPKDSDKTKKTLSLLMKMKDKVKFYKFIFNNLKDDAFSVSYNAIT